MFRFEFCNACQYTIAAKAHALACLIHKCIISRDAVTLTRTFVAYVRPIYEYASVIWSPYHVNQISKLESKLQLHGKSRNQKTSQ